MTVLWVLVLLALIAASFTYTTRTEINLARNQIEGAQAEALAEAGLARALLGLLAGQRNIDLGDQVERLLTDRPALRGALEARPEVQAAQDGRAGADLETETGEPPSGPVVTTLIPNCSRRISWTCMCCFLLISSCVITVTAPNDPHR